MGKHQSNKQHVATDCHEDDNSQHESQQPRTTASDVPSTSGGRAAVVAPYRARQVRVGHGAGCQQSINQLLKVPFQALLNVTDLNQFSFAAKALTLGTWLNKKKPLRSCVEIPTLSLSSLSGLFSMGKYLHFPLAGIHPGAPGLRPLPPV